MSTSSAPVAACCACTSTETTVVLDLGAVPPSDVFPDLVDPGPDPLSRLALMVCAVCGLVQIVEDDTEPEQPRGIEPQALVDQAEAALGAADASGWLTGATVREFPSPHGGTWIPHMEQRGFSVAAGPADVVLDSFGVMHDADQLTAWRDRAAATAPDGVLVVQVHTVAAIVQARQWTSLRHGHVAYYSLTALQRLLAAVGMSVVDAHTFPLYGSAGPGGRIDGTLLVAARHGEHAGSERVAAVLAHEERIGVTDPERLSALQESVDTDVQQLRSWLTEARDAGTSVLAYGAASRTVALFSLAGLDRGLVAAVADGSPSKQGRRMPTTDVPIISPADLVDAAPDLVLVTLPDLLPELRRAWPQLDGRWITEPGGDVVA